MPDSAAPPLADSPPVSDEVHAELDRLTRELAVRHSMTYLAVALVSCLAWVMSGGIAVHLVVDALRLSRSFSVLLWPFAALAVVCLGVAAVGFVRGRRLLLAERGQFRRLLELRRRAGLDL